MLDKVFADPKLQVTDFEFNASVVKVFDDMVVRSVPFYIEMQRMVAELAADFAIKNTNIYDLGCSTGTTMMSLNQKVDKNIQFIGVDEADEMLKSCQTNLERVMPDRPVKLVNADLNKGIELENPSVVILCLTLQFVRPLKRQKLIEDIYRQLPENGALIIVEKVLGEDSMFNRLFIKHYYEFKKRNDYTETEISKKREALENVLIPYRLKENEELLAECGFKHIDTFFKWYNFAGFVAVK
ncbi:MAG: carboxy-S-adenosyl-L-methionine synthase CmoA [Flavobacteriaceae bacterium]|nr:carboxy-S-adenosyl-L-methionine synthase CmoA [Flavobacteriaceae bacterium]